jgi:hypothetical protein
MAQSVSKTISISSVTVSVVVLGTYAYCVALPYRLSSSQEQFLEMAMPAQFIGAFLAVVTAIAASIISRLRHTPKHGLLETFAVVLSVIALVLVLCSSYSHSTSHRPSTGNAPNNSRGCVKTPGLGNTSLTFDL